MMGIRTQYVHPRNKIMPTLSPTCLRFLAPVAFAAAGAASLGAQQPGGIQHSVVYRQPARFAAWPANLGMWSWGEEILVGFVEAAHQDRGGFHSYDQSTARDTFARSLDGGVTWQIEDAYQQGQTGWRYTNRLERAVDPRALEDPIDFAHPDLALTFLRRTNDVGPSHFYVSRDRGRWWQGPYALPNLDTPGIATRTDYHAEGPRRLLAFFTVAKSDQKEGRVLAARTHDGGISWERVGWVGPEPEGFEIMPSSVRLSPGEILTVVRRHEADGEDLLSAYRSVDDGRTWHRIGNPVADTGYGGSPPALLSLGERGLVLVYVVRSNQGSRLEAIRSGDGGETWGQPVVLRADGATSDAGYPRMVQRPDGKLVVTYYWNHAAIESGEPWRYIAATLFDPAILP